MEERKRERKEERKKRTTLRGYFYIISSSQIHFLLDFLLPFLFLFFSLFLSITVLRSYSYVSLPISLLFLFVSGRDVLHRTENIFMHHPSPSSSKRLFHLPRSFSSNSSNNSLDYLMCRKNVYLYIYLIYLFLPFLEINERLLEKFGETEKEKER